MNNVLTILAFAKHLLGPNLPVRRERLSVESSRTGSLLGQCVLLYSILLGSELTSHQVIDYSNSLGVNPVVTLCEFRLNAFLSNVTPDRRSSMGHPARVIGILWWLHFTQDRRRFRQVSVYS